ncbi:MAG: hypothetical protein IJT28_01720 [Bacteroidaceae bacterium]|nr:hypothetical protein [Bacteroidaceae bacterium]
MDRKMMTFVCALMLFVLQSETIQAQQSMLDGDPVWVYRQSIGTTIKNAPANLFWNDEALTFYHIYYIKGDTTIQNRVYKKLYHEYLNEKGKYAFDTQGVELVTPIREEGNKILAPRSFYQKRWGNADWYYEIVGSTDDEIVVYDFDAFKAGTVSIQQKGQIFAQSIENLSKRWLLDRSYRQEYYSLRDDNQTLQIIDGIGCWKNNVLLFAPFADDSFFVPAEVETEMEYRTMNNGRDILLVIWISDEFCSGFVEGNYDESFFDSSWVTKTDDGKMMVTLVKASTESQLCYYVQDGKIVFTSTDAKQYGSGYGFVEKYLNYHINDEEEMVDLGLSVKWSTHNLGASSPTDFGQYYFWGDTVGIRRPINNDERVPYTGQYTEFESRLQSHIAKTRYDVAYQLQGKNWRMPTPDEYQELIDSCSCVRIYVNNVYGYLLTGPNGNTLFLPGAEYLEPWRDGMILNTDGYDLHLFYWTDETIPEKATRIYHNNQLEVLNQTYMNRIYKNYLLKSWALPIRAVYDDSGDKWLSVNEYLYYDRYDYIDWGWNEDDIVIPTLETCNAFITRYQKLFGADNMIYQKIFHKTFCDHFRQYVSTRLDDYKARAIETYEGSDGKTLYFVDKIDDDFLNTFEGQSGQINLLSAINQEEDVTGYMAYTKNCTYTMEDIDPKFAVPDNQYLRVRPTSQSAQPFIAFNLPVLMANTNYTLRITMAPETVDSIAPLGNQFRINMFIKTPEGQWPKTRNFIYKNPLDPTGKQQNFTSSADTLTVIDLPLNLDYAADVMIQLQSYVSTKELKTYTRHLRIANIEVINNGRKYDPFIAEQKTWKVGWFPTSEINETQMITTYYFDGDTIIGGQTAKRMLCDKVSSIDGEWRETKKEYVGAWYEQDRKVYCTFPDEDQFRLLYDFTPNVNEQITIYNQQAGAEWLGVVSGMYLGGNNHFKGVTHFIKTPSGVSGTQQDKNWSTSWLEGVGGTGIPTDNIGNETSEYCLMSCQVGDEVIYLNEALLDGCATAVPSGESYAKKRRFDFTHTIKTQPKTPQRRGEETTLYGEYNERLLDINLKMLNTAYMVRITNQKTSEVVYEKAVNAGSIVALDIDISAYPKGQYEITIVNSDEVFNGVIDTSATGIEEIIHKSQFIMHNDAILNLQGQRIKTLQKGLNIVNGKKVWVK